MKPASSLGQDCAREPRERERDTGEKLTASWKPDVNILSHFLDLLLASISLGAILDPGNSNNSQLHHGGEAAELPEVIFTLLPVQYLPA